MAYVYSNNEYTEMVRVLAKSNDNVARACHEFGRLYPNLPAPSRDLMLQATQRLRDHGQFHSSSSEMVSEEEEEERDSEGVGEEGDDEDGGDEEADCEEEDDEEGNEEYGEEVQEEEKEEALKPMPKKESAEFPVQLPRKSFPLGLIKNVEVSLSRFKTQDQKILHQYLYGQICPDRNVTGNIKNFRGFQWKVESTEYKAKLMETARMEPRHLRTMCDMLDLENYGGPSKLAQRLMDFLQQPGASFPNVARRPLLMTDGRDAAVARGLRRTRSHSPPRVTCRHEEYESDEDTKANDSKENSEDSDGSGSVKSSGSEASNTGSEVEVVIGTESREAEAKVIPDRKRPPPKIYIDKKKARDMLVRSTQGEKASSEESYVGEDSSEEEEGSDEEDSEEESDTPADKKAKRPPTDEEIKKCVRQILEGANLETITMKTLCKEVYSHYPDFDLEHKKDFIKEAVKSV